MGAGPGPPVGGQGGVGRWETGAGGGLPPSVPRPAAVRILTPGEHPARTHAAACTPAPAATGPGDGPDAADQGDTWILVDQFEEVFTLCHDPVERSPLPRPAAAGPGPDSRLRVVIAVRADFYGRCAEHRALAEALCGSGLLVGPMTSAELRAAVVRPADAHGLIVERALTARLLRDAEREPGALPLVSHALLETWRRRKGRALTLQAYEAAGGVHGAVAQTAEDVYTRLSPHQAALARRILLRLIAPGEGAQDTRRPAAPRRAGVRQRQTRRAARAAATYSNVSSPPGCSPWTGTPSISPRSPHHLLAPLAAGSTRTRTAARPPQTHRGRPQLAGAGPRPRGALPGQQTGRGDRTLRQRRHRPRPPAAPPLRAVPAAARPLAPARRAALRARPSPGWSGTS
ncbi:hypothetical protein [Streptomyces albus]|uniref:nSTAND1 domain-containing NTPase n=1 Tax=Streptomyces albus TaxID=1888 RepID=UPI003D687303